MKEILQIVKELHQQINRLNIALNTIIEDENSAVEKLQDSEIELAKVAKKFEQKLLNKTNGKK